MEHGEYEKAYYGKLQERFLADYYDIHMISFILFRYIVGGHTSCGGYRKDLRPKSTSAKSKAVKVFRLETIRCSSRPTKFRKTTPEEDSKRRAVQGKVDRLDNPNKTDI